MSRTRRPFKRHSIRVGAEHRFLIAAIVIGVLVSTTSTAHALGGLVEAAIGKAPSAVDTDRDGVLDAPTTAAAVKFAKAEGEPVEDLSQRTETFSTLANPDGTFTATDHAGAVRVLDGESWVDLDLNLKRTADGNYSPKAAIADVTVGGAGTTVAARVEFEDDQSFAITWPTALPTPTIDGRVATYKLSKTTDLVVSVTGTGVAAHLRLNAPPAADDPVFTFGLSTTNLDVSKNGRGLKVTDETATQVGRTSSLVAWDARVDEAGDPAEVVPLDVDLSKERREGNKASQVLEVAPPDGYLHDPERVYPVIIDPDINAVNQLRDTYTRAGETAPAGDLPHLMIGREGGSSNANPARAFVQWENTFLAGKTITAASMNFYQYFTGSCSSKEVNVHPLVAEFRETTTVDTNRPAVNTGTGDSTTFTANRGPGCTDGAGFVSVGVLNIAKSWAKGPSNGGYTNWGVQLNVPSASGSDATFERRFCSEEPSSNTSVACSSPSRVPFMKFTYTDAAPSAPSAPNATVSGQVVTLSTQVTGGTGTNLRARFLVKTGSTVVFDGYSTYVPSGSVASTTMPLPLNGTYTIQAWASDGAQSSTSPSPTTTATLDRTPTVGELVVKPNSATPTLSAAVTSPLGSDVRAKFVVKQGSTTVLTGFSPYVSSGSYGSLDASLPAGNYTVQAWADEGTYTSASPSSTVSFTAGAVVAPDPAPEPDYSPMYKLIPASTSSGALAFPVSVPSGHTLALETSTGDILVKNAQGTPVGRYVRYAVDASDQELVSTLTISGTTITQTVTRPSGTTYPVFALPIYEPIG